MTFSELEAYFVALGASDGFSAVANVLELVGIVITCVASLFAYLAAKRSRTAAEQARDATDEIKKKINDFVLATELGSGPIKPIADQLVF